MNPLANGLAWFHVGLLCVACGGQSDATGHSSSAGGTAATGGGTAAGGVAATGGADVTAGGIEILSTAGNTGGADVGSAAGGNAWSSGATSASIGGVTSSSSNTVVATTGASSSSGTGAASSTTGGRSSAASCVNVECPSLPNSCKKIVQNPGECCPACLDSGCPPCVEITCSTGTHIETLTGACCPECVKDKPDACQSGRQSYASSLASMLDKYGSAGCKNSTDCVIVPENNLCAHGCGFALPAETAKFLESNLPTSAAACATCAPPPEIFCELMVPACVNGRCAEVNPS